MAAPPASPPASPIELGLEPGMVVDEVLAALSQAYRVERHPPVDLDNTFLDTFDARLRSARLTLVLSRTRGDRKAQLVLTSAEGSVIRAAAPAGRAARLFVADLPSGPIRERVGEAIEMRALVAQAKVKSRQGAATVQDRQGKTVVRLLFEQAAVSSGPGAAVALTGRLRASPVLGYDRCFADVMAILGSLPGLRPVKRPLRDEAISVAGGRPSGVSAKIAVGLKSSMRADEATIALCRRLAEVVEDNMAGTVDDVDSEFLHDLRVAIRRSRSVLREMRGVLPPAEADQARIDLRWVQEVTGPTRDLDVQLLEWPTMVAGLADQATDDLRPLQDLLARHRRRAFAAMVGQLRGPPFADAWRAWRDLLARPVSPAEDPARPNAHRPIAEVAGARIVAVYRRMVKMGAVITEHSPPEALHDLRKRGKECRYLLELYGSLWPQGTVSPMVTALKGLQDVLGRFQDDEVQATYLRSLGPELMATTGNTDTLLALGLVIDGLTRDQAAAREAFSGRFAAFADQRNRELVATTFRAPT
jgi:CHAD domain-containing protein